MIPEERRRILLDRLECAHALSIAELAEALDVSSMTIRRDIKTLERQGQVVAVSGGVRSTSRILKELPEEAKLRAEIGFKRAIARAAAAYVTDEQAIFIDAGTTGFQLAQFVVDRSNLAVVTNDFTTVSLLADYPSIELFHTGGRVDHANRSAVGAGSAAFINTMNFDVAFISSSSWDVKHGLTTPDQAKVLLKQNVIAAASRSILIADSSKFGRFGKFKVVNLQRFDCIITDARLSRGDADAIHDLGVKLIQVDEETVDSGGP